MRNKTPIGVPSSNFHYWILGVVFAYQALLLSFFIYSAWNRRSAERPQTLTGEGVLIYGDGCGYYAWLRSGLVDGDWNFENEFDNHNPLRQDLPSETNATGRRANHYPIGPALVWAPATVVTHVLCQCLPVPWPADGYSLPYQLTIGFSGLCISAVTLILLYAIGRVYVEPLTSALAVAALTLGTTLLNYQAIEISMAHGCGAAATALLVWYWLRTFGEKSPIRWIALGAMVGFAALMRYQLALLAILPAGECLLSVIGNHANNNRKSILARCGLLLLAGLSAIAVFAPQLMAWKFIYGQYLVSPLVLSHCWLSPDFDRILVSVDRGYFYWTPLTLILFGGTVYYTWVRTNLTLPVDSAPPRFALSLLLAAFALQVYLLASISGDGVFLGSSFGYRHLTEANVLLLPGLALVFQTAKRRQNRLLAALCSALCVWNVLLMAQYHREILPRKAGAELGTLVQSSIELVRRWPEGMALFLSGPALLGLILLKRSDESENAEAATLRPFELLQKRRRAARAETHQEVDSLAKS